MLIVVFFWGVLLITILKVAPWITDFIFGVKKGATLDSEVKNRYNAAYILLIVALSFTWLSIGSATGMDNTMKKVSYCVKLYSGQTSYIENDFFLDKINNHRIDNYIVKEYYIKAHESNLNQLSVEIMRNEKKINKEFHLENIDVTYNTDSHLYYMFSNDYFIGYIEVKRGLLLGKLVFNWSGVALQDFVTPVTCG